MTSPWIEQLVSAVGATPDRIGVVVVDHGSRVARSNELLNDVVSLFASHSRLPIVEAAHMELAEPSIEVAFRRCVEQGAAVVVVFPFFLLPGRHWQQDIPRLAQAAAAQHPGTRYVVTAPLAIHPLIAQIMQDRIQQCVAAVAGQGRACDLCQDQPQCFNESWLSPPTDGLQG